MKDDQSLSIREEEDFGEYMSKVLIYIGIGLLQICGWSFVTPIILGLFDYDEIVPKIWKYISVGYVGGFVGGMICLVIGGGMKRR